MVGQCERRHSHGRRRLHQFVHRTHGLQDAELGMHVQMRKGNRGGHSGNGGLHRRRCRGVCSCHLKRGGLKLRGFVADGCAGEESFPPKQPTFAHGKKHAARGPHVVCRVVGFSNRLPEEGLVQLSQRGPFVGAPAATRQFAKVRPGILGIQDRLRRQRGRIEPEPAQFGTDDGHVKTDVVAHDVGRLAQCIRKLV